MHCHFCMLYYARKFVYRWPCWHCIAVIPSSCSLFSVDWRPCIFSLMNISCKWWNEMCVLFVLHVTNTATQSLWYRMARSGTSGWLQILEAATKSTKQTKQLRVSKSLLFKRWERRSRVSLQAARRKKQSSWSFHTTLKMMRKMRSTWVLSCLDDKRWLAPGGRAGGRVRVGRTRDGHRKKRGKEGGREMRESRNRFFFWLDKKIKKLKNTQTQ